ncbi:hypothetical protein [Flavobacterium croceum]|uniref:hypothetical protein n=1 Tax=Flavobacterium croceum TaxID=370975 RepID=UPI0024A8E1F8|nr:hypothetical protein [Flavobacterium croceum]
MPNSFRQLNKVEYKSNYRFRNEFGMTAWVRNDSIKVKRIVCHAEFISASRKSRIQIKL